MSEIPELYVVMVPLEGEEGWVDPAIWFWSAAEEDAREWARAWSHTHTGEATVYRCTPIAQYRYEEHP